jgi:hypothetical protein
MDYEGERKPWRPTKLHHLPSKSDDLADIIGEGNAISQRRCCLPERLSRAHLISLAD